MIARECKARVEHMLSRNPGVVLTGMRQVGKTTLAMEIAEERGAAYLDLERPRDRARLADVEAYCERNAGRQIVFDEIQRVPGLFEALRGIIDRRRREGRRTGRFLFLGSASIDLLRQSSETLAGRVAYCEMQPLSVDEVGGWESDRLWQRGGLPDSFLAADDHDSLDWRLNFIRTYLERDIPGFRPRVPGETLRRFWTMLAHNQGQTFNAALLGRSLGVASVTVSRYLDLLVDLLLVRRLQPWFANVRKRLVKAPKTYLRDSGICHALLGIDSLDSLFGHPVVGGSWEGFVIENLLGCISARVQAGFYRTAGGAEVDLVLDLGGGELWVIEIKRSTAPSLSRGFHNACEDLRPTGKFVVHPGGDDFPLGRGVEAVSLQSMRRRLSVAT